MVAFALTAAPGTLWGAKRCRSRRKGPPPLRRWQCNLRQRRVPIERRPRNAPPSSTGRSLSHALLVTATLLTVLLGPAPPSALAIDTPDALTAEFARTVGAKTTKKSILSENTLLRRYVVTDAEAVLRWALPVPSDSPLRIVQRDLEEAGLELQTRGLLHSGLRAALRHVEHAVRTVQQHRLDILAESGGLSHPTQATEYLRTAETELEQLLMEMSRWRARLPRWPFGPNAAATSSTVSNAQRAVAEHFRQQALDAVSRLEEMSIRGVPFRIPRKYDAYPRLRGRATVELSLEKGPGTTTAAFVDDATGRSLGGQQTVTAVLDGWSAPLTAGHFVDLVQRRHFDGMPVATAERGLFVLFADARASASSSSSAAATRQLPLEILLDGESAPLYGESLDMVGVGGEQPVLPIAPFGSLAMAHSEDDVNDAADAFFAFTLDSRSVAATNSSGNVFTGTYAAFGYAIDEHAASFLRQLQPGDRIRSVRLVRGREHWYPDAEAEARALSMRAAPSTTPRSMAASADRPSAP